MVLTISRIVINDVLEELSEENKRLLNELMFANKSVNLLTQFKSFIDLISQKFKTNLDSNELKSFYKLNEEISQFIRECDEFNNNKNEVLTENVKKIENQETDSDFSDNSDDCGSDDTKSYQKNDINEKSEEVMKNWAINPTNGLILSKGTHKPTESDQQMKAVTSNDNKNSHQKNDNNEHYSWPYRRDGKYHCHLQDCLFTCMDISQLNDHIKRQHKVVKEKTHKCSDCGKTFSSKTLLCIHDKHIHQLLDEPLICDFNGCNKHYRTELSFKMHQKIHFKEKKFVCDHPNCDFSAITKAKLSEHKVRHSKERPYVCTVEDCHKTFKCPRSLKIHYNSHITSNERNFICTHEGCGKTFKAKINLSTHNWNYHRKDAKEKKFVCHWPGCEYKTATKCRLTEHETIHYDQRDHACLWPSCAKRFKQKQNLALHMRIHTNDKRFVCEWPGCDYRCTAWSNLKGHKKVHQK